MSQRCQYRKCALAVFDHLVGGTRSPTCATSVQYVAAQLRVMIFALRSGAWFQWLSSERLTARGEVFGPGARPGLISSGLRGAMGLGVGRVTVAPFSSPIRGTQLGDGCGP